MIYFYIFKVLFLKSQSTYRRRKAQSVLWIIFKFSLKEKKNNLDQKVPRVPFCRQTLNSHPKGHRFGGGRGSLGCSWDRGCGATRTDRAFNFQARGLLKSKEAFGFLAENYRTWPEVVGPAPWYTKRRSCPRSKLRRELLRA